MTSIIETPVGLVDGMNTTYTLGAVPDNFLGLYLNEAWVDPARYVRTGNTIVFGIPIDASFAGLSFNAVYLIAAVSPNGAVVTTGNYITNAEFQALNPNLDLSAFPAITISGLITAASAEIDNYLQYSLWAEQVLNETNEAVVSSNGNLLIYTHKFPIVAVSAISLKLGTVHLDLTMLDSHGTPRYDIPSRARSIMYPFQEISMTGVFSIRNFYQLRDREIYAKVSYTAGYSIIPNEIKLACSLLTRDMIVREMANPSLASSASQGGISMSWSMTQDGSGDSQLMDQAKNLLQSYRKFWS